MRKILVITVFALFSILYSCEKNPINENTNEFTIEEKDIESSRSIEMNNIILTVSFDNKGGTVSVKNLDNRFRGWWINDIKNEDTGVYYNAAKVSASGDGIVAKIVSEDTVAIKVKPSKEKRTWTVTMESDDFCCYILVKQN